MTAQTANNEIYGHVTLNMSSDRWFDQVNMTRTWADLDEMRGWLAWYRRWGGEVLHVEIY
jgi:hypothetical protein